MKKLTLIIGFLASLFLSGCFIRPKAATVLTIRAKEDNTKLATLGFKEAAWATVDGDLTVIARGIHPREHETYAFFINEPSYAFLPRWILVTPSATSQEYDIDLWVPCNPIADHCTRERIRFKETVQDIKHRKGRKLKLRLKDVVMTSPDNEASVIVSGRIVAKPETEEYVEERMAGRIIEETMK